MRRGGCRSRQPVGDLAVWVSGGRWGHRRVRVGECFRELCAEDLYTELLRARALPPPRQPRSLSVTLGGVRFQVTVEVIPNAVWRHGRVFLVCPRCANQRTRLYAPVENSGRLTCRVCLGLTYESQTLYNYKPGGPIFAGFVFSHRDAAMARTQRVRDDRAAASSARWAERKGILAKREERRNLTKG
jgi:hypothetical protein